MTVASLWKALDRAECGTAIGSVELLNHHRPKGTTITPWNHNEFSKKTRPPALAIDLSIWICEALTSTAMAENHADPVLHLVYARTLHLLNLGVKLVGVIEGKRRVEMTDGGDDQYRKRRTGTAFWRACEKCEEMLRMLGVPVVRAKAEGEALCALLNSRGVVDGVISSDGDCFLFGAKVLYTKFTIENLRQGKVMRYNVDEIKAFLDDDDSDSCDQIIQEHQDKANSDIVSLTRDDLIAFAILTGSDVAGDGLPKVGCRKALRFIRKCQIDSPLRPERAAFEELLSWGRAAQADRPFPADASTSQSGVCCSRCCHGGTKVSHLKHGCKKCGTNPGDVCLEISSGEKFRRSLRDKALAMDPKFSPQVVAGIYHAPNENQLPAIFLGTTSQKLKMQQPILKSFLDCSYIIRGRSYSESRAYVLQSLTQLLARYTLTNNPVQTSSKFIPPKLSSNRNIPKPKKITKGLTRSGASCYEVQWVIAATTTDTDGNALDEYEFTTIEDQALMKKCNPQLVDEFESREKERLKQGRAEQDRRQAFLNSMMNGDRGPGEKPLKREDKTRRGFIPHIDTKFKLSSLGTKKEKQLIPGHTPAKHSPRHAIGDDALQLLRYIDPPLSPEHDSIRSSSSISTIESETVNLGLNSKNYPPGTEFSPYKLATTPSHMHFLRLQNGEEPLHEHQFNENEALETCIANLMQRFNACWDDTQAVRIDGQHPLMGDYGLIWKSPLRKRFRHTPFESPIQDYCRSKSHSLFSPVRDCFDISSEPSAKISFTIGRKVSYEEDEHCREFNTFDTDADWFHHHCTNPSSFVPLDNPWNTMEGTKNRLSMDGQGTFHIQELQPHMDRRSVGLPACKEQLWKRSSHWTPTTCQLASSSTARSWTQVVKAIPTPSDHSWVSTFLDSLDTDVDFANLNGRDFWNENNEDKSMAQLEEVPIEPDWARHEASNNTHWCGNHDNMSRLEEIVEPALAKWMQKSILARQHLEQRSILQDAMWNEHGNTL